MRRIFQFSNETFDDEMKYRANKRILLHEISYYFQPSYLLLKIVLFFNVLHTLSPMLLFLAQLGASPGEPSEYSLAIGSIWDISKAGLISWEEYGHVVMTSWLFNTFGVILDMFFVFSSMSVTRLTNLLTREVRDFDHVNDSNDKTKWKTLVDRRVGLINVRNDLQTLFGVPFLVLYLTGGLVLCTTVYQVNQVNFLFISHDISEIPE